MGLFEFFKKKSKREGAEQERARKIREEQKQQERLKTQREQTRSEQPKPTNFALLPNGAPFSIVSMTIKVVKQYYSGRQEEINVGAISATIYRSTQNGAVKIDFSDLSALRSKNIIQSNQSFDNPLFQYNKDGEGNEFASAEVGNTFSHLTSGKEFVSLLQITKQNGKIVSFIINNLPNEGDFYYLIMFQ